MRLTISRFAALAVVAAWYLAVGGEGLAECLPNLHLHAAIRGGIFSGEWQSSDSAETWVAVLHVESDEWRPDSVQAYAVPMLERRFFLAEPIAVLMGKLPAAPVWLMSGELRNPGLGTRILVEESLEIAVGDTVVQVKTDPIGGLSPGIICAGPCSTVPVERGYVMGRPLMSILARPGVAKRDSVTAVPDH